MKKTIATTLILSTILAGCASPAGHSVLSAKVDKNLVEADAALATSKATPATTNVSNGNIIKNNGSYLPLRKLPKVTKDLARAKTEAIQIEINQTFTSLNEIASVVATLTGMPVSINADANATPTGTMPPGAPMPGPGGGPGVPPMVPGLTQGPKPMGMSMSGMQSTAPPGVITPSSPFTANYSGSLAGFMTLAATYYGLSWKAENSGLRVYLMDSRTYRIAALPGDTRLSANVESASNTSTGGGTQGGSSTNSTGVGYTSLSVWTAMESAIKQMLGTNGKVAASPATGTITVTDTPQVLERLSVYIDEQNKALNRQVNVNVRVLSVEITDTNNFGVNWDAVFAQLQKEGEPFSISLKSAFSSATGAGNMIISAPTTSPSAWAGSKAIISALNTQGRVSELTSATLTTLNNQAAPVNVGRRVGYLQSSSSTAATTAGGAPTVTLTPGTIQTGFSMSLVPHILDGKDMLLQYNMDLSSLLELKSISSGTSTIQTPDVSTSNFIQRVRIQSGETLVVAGFDHDNLSAVAKGIGSSQNPALGNRDGSTTRTVLVVLIQPLISL